MPPRIPLTIKVRVVFEPRDLWIGAYWDCAPVYWRREDLIFVDRYRVFICLVPMFPILITWNRPNTEKSELYDPLGKFLES